MLREIKRVLAALILAGLVLVLLVVVVALMCRGWLSDLVYSLPFVSPPPTPEPTMLWGRPLDKWLTEAVYVSAAVGASLALVSLGWYAMGWAIKKWQNVDMRDGVFVPQIRRGDLLNPNNSARTYENWDVSMVDGWTADHQLEIVKSAKKVQDTSAAFGFLHTAGGRGGGGGRGGITIAQGKLEAGVFEEERKLLEAKRLALGGEPVDVAMAPVADRRLGWRDAVHMSAPGRFVIGQHKESGDVVSVNMEETVNLGILGLTGSGKTSFTGMQIAVTAIVNGYHLVILDPKGGTDWSALDGWAEWYSTDPTVFPAQIDAIAEEYERRKDALTEAGARHIYDLPGWPPIVVLIDDMGKLARDARRLVPRGWAAAEQKLAGLMGMVRMTGIHFVLIDQHTADWNGAIFQHVSQFVVYKMAPNRGNTAGAYNAHLLPKPGWFMLDGDVYESWLVAKTFPQYKDEFHPAGTSSTLLLPDGESSTPGSTPGSTPSTPGVPPVKPVPLSPPQGPKGGGGEDGGTGWNWDDPPTFTGKYDGFAWRWMARHRHLSPTQADLREAIAEDHGLDAATIKSTVSRLWKRLDFDSIGE